VRVVDSVALYDLLALATSELATTQVRAVAWLRARQLKGWLDASSASASDPAEKAHLAYAAAQIEQFQKDPKRLDMPPPSEPPEPKGTMFEAKAETTPGSDSTRRTMSSTRGTIASGGSY